MNEDKSTRYHRLRRRADLLGTARRRCAVDAAVTGGSHRLRELAAALAQWVPEGSTNRDGDGRDDPGDADSGDRRAALRVLHGYLLEHRYGLSTQSRGIGSPIRQRLASALCSRAGTSVVYGALRQLARRLVVDLGGGVRRGDDWPGAARARRAAADLLQVQAARSPVARRTAVELAAGARTSVNGVFEWVLSGHTRKANAALAGIGRTRRILLSDTLLADYSEDEIEVILAHELAHHVHRDLWRGIAVQAYAAGGFFVASVLLVALAIRSGCGGFRSRRPAAVAAGRRRVDVPAAAGGRRRLARAGTRRRPLCVETTRNVDAFVTAMKRLSQQNLAEEYPSPLVRWLFYSHPPIRERIDAARAFGRGGTPCSVALFGVRALALSVALSR